MPGIVKFPQVVREALKTYGDLFANEPERQHFGEYLTGLMIADRKTVSGINAEFAETTDQSCLNRFVTEVAWDEQAMNERRLEEHQKDSSSRYSDRGVIAIDDVLIDHDGQMIDDVGYFGDHAEQRTKIAHDYMIANYVCPGGKHYSLEFRRFKKRAQCEAAGETFEDHTKLFCQLIDWVCELGMGDCQLRCGQGQTRHMYLVMLAYSLLVGQLRQNRAQEWASAKLTTIGEARRAMLRESLRSTIAWVVDHVAELGHSKEHLFVKLGLA